MKYRKLIYSRALASAALASLALAPQLCMAQQSAFYSSSEGGPDVVVASNAHAEAAGSRPVGPTSEGPLAGRWLQVDTLSHSERYRNAFATGGQHLFDNAQQRSMIAGKVKLDAEGRYVIGFRASSGRYFNWSYGGYTGENFSDRVADQKFGPSYNAGPGQLLEVTRSVFSDSTGFSLASKQIESNGWQFYVRELYFKATPVKQVSVEFGSFGIERGLSTEITTFDEDGYLSGERLRLHDPKHLFFDEIGFTNAFFGDIATPNFFDRGGSLKKSNYRQVFANKQLNRRVGFSGEYTWQAGTDTLREAAVIGVGESRVFDSVRFEAYERTHARVFAGAANSPIGPIPVLTIAGASGYAITAAKKLGKLSGDIGFASVDKGYGAYSGYRFLAAVGFPLNGDAYGTGSRAFTHASYTFAPGMTAFGFYTHQVGDKSVRTFNTQGINAGVNFDLKAMMNRAKLVM